MAKKLYLCALEHTLYFNIEADENDEERVREWLATHSHQDVYRLALTNSYSNEWDERIVDIVKVGDYDSHIILKGDD